MDYIRAASSFLGASAPEPSAADGLGAIDDVAFAVLVLRLRSLDAEIAERIRDLHGQSEVKKAYQARIDELRRLTSGREPSDSVPLGDVSPQRFDYAWSDAEQAVVERTDGTDIDGGDNDVVKYETLQNEIARLESALDALNGDTEIEMMKLNQLVHRRQTTMTMFSNLLASTHESAMAVVRNIGK